MKLFFCDTYWNLVLLNLYAKTKNLAKLYGDQVDFFIQKMSTILWRCPFNLLNYTIAGNYDISEYFEWILSIYKIKYNLCKRSFNTLG